MITGQTRRRTSLSSSRVFINPLPSLSSARPTRQPQSLPRCFTFAPRRGRRPWRACCRSCTAPSSTSPAAGDAARQPVPQRVAGGVPPRVLLRPARRRQRRAGLPLVGGARLLRSRVSVNHHHRHRRLIQHAKTKGFFGDHPIDASFSSLITVHVSCSWFSLRLGLE